MWTRLDPSYSFTFLALTRSLNLFPSSKWKLYITEILEPFNKVKSSFHRYAKCRTFDDIPNLLHLANLEDSTSVHISSTTVCGWRSGTNEWRRNGYTLREGTSPVGLLSNVASEERYIPFRSNVPHLVQGNHTGG